MTLLSTGHYILEDGKPVRCDDILKWARWFETADRHLALTRVGDAEVSTVFLGLDHRFGGDGPPILWETMVFGGALDQECERYSSAEAAAKGHAKWVEKVKAQP